MSASEVDQLIERIARTLRETPRKHDYFAAHTFVAEDAMKEVEQACGCPECRHER